MPAFKLSSTMRSFSAVVQRRRQDEQMFMLDGCSSGRTVRNDMQSKSAIRAIAVAAAISPSSRRRAAAPKTCPCRKGRDMAKNKHNGD
jgi:hypothetical protein